MPAARHQCAFAHPQYHEHDDGYHRDEHEQRRIGEGDIRLAEIDNIIGVKEATADLSRLDAIKQSVDESFLLLSGDDLTSKDFLLQGGHGVISVTANVAPKLMHEMCEFAIQGDADAAAAADDRLVGLHKDLFIESNPIPVKWAVHRLGLIQAGIRLPLTWLTESAEPPVLQAMQQAGVI